MAGRLNPKAAFFVVNWIYPFVCSPLGIWDPTNFCLLNYRRSKNVDAVRPSIYRFAYIRSHLWPFFRPPKAPELNCHLYPRWELHSSGRKNQSKRPNVCPGERWQGWGWGPNMTEWKTHSSSEPLHTITTLLSPCRHTQTVTLELEHVYGLLVPVLLVVDRGRRQNGGTQGQWTPVQQRT